MYINKTARFTLSYKNRLKIYMKQTCIATCMCKLQYMYILWFTVESIYSDHLKKKKNSWSIKWAMNVKKYLPIGVSCLKIMSFVESAPIKIM